MVSDERPWLKPLGLLYGQVMDWRNQLYDRGLLSVQKVSCPVVSVGNLTVGGTGKTPMVMTVLKMLIHAGKKPGVVSRGYGRKSEGVQEVTLSKTSDCERFGDEPVLIKSRFPEVPVYVGQRRYEAAARLLEQHQVDILVADDAFQHRALERQLDIVVIDVTQGLESLAPLPWGLGRERSTGLKRAKVVVLNKVNLAQNVQLERWRAWMKNHVGAHAVVLEANYEGRGLEPLVTAGRVNFKSWVACAGLARPQTFLSLLEDELRLNIHRHYWFKDHHSYRDEDLNRILQNLSDDEGVVISEKDAVKWREFDSLKLDRVAVVGLEIKWGLGEENLARALAALSR